MNISMERISRWIRFLCCNCFMCCYILLTTLPPAVNFFSLLYFTLLYLTCRLLLCVKQSKALSAPTIYARTLQRFYFSIPFMFFSDPWLECISIYFGYQMIDLNHFLICTSDKGSHLVIQFWHEIVWNVTFVYVNNFVIQW